MKVLIELGYLELKAAVESGTLIGLADTVEGAKVVNASTETPVAEEPAKAPKTTKAKKSETTKDKKPEPEPTPTPAEVEVAESVEVEDAKAEPEATYTLIQVREKLSELSRAGKQAQVKALIEKFGAAKLSEIKEESYAALMKEAEGL